MAFKIEKGVPIRTRSRYPLRKMRVGDSFWMPDERSVRSYMYGMATRLGIRVSVRADRKGRSKGLRVWRIE